MVNKTISFSTGNLIVNDKNISFHLKSGNINNVNTIGRENIGHQDQQRMRILPKAEFVYIFQNLIIGFIVGVVGLIIGISTQFFIILYFGFGFVFFAGFLYFAWMWLDMMLGLNVAKPILLSLYGVDAVRVIVQNIYGGNNLQFFVGLEEQSRIPKFDNYKLEKIYNVENVNNSIVGKNNIDDLEKLAALRDKGILSQEEFDLKKKQILGL